MIIFKTDTTLEIVEEFDESTDTITKETNEFFSAGELVDADICDDRGSHVDIQFADSGGVAFNIEKESFEIV